MSQNAAPKFAVDERGLAQIMERRGKSYTVLELMANCFDSSASWVRVSLTPVEGRPLAELVVEDDAPEGWADLKDAYTLFAPSKRKGDPEKRGRFGLGEKLVLAICDEAEIVTTSGGVRFDRFGRHPLRRSRAAGSIFTGVLRLTRDELADLEAAARLVIAPVPTTLNGVPLPERVLVRRVQAVTLPTEYADAEGYLRRSQRQTHVDVYEPTAPGEAWLHEGGIPIMALPDDGWSYNVHQKIPVGMEKDAVTPGYLRAVRVAVLNETSDLVEGHEAATRPWVRDAASDERVEPAVVQHVMKERYGGKRVIADPSDPEGTKLAVAKGYTVIQPGSLSADEWQQVRRSGAALPAGQVTPSPKPFSAGGEPLRLVPPEKWTADVSAFGLRAKAVARALLGTSIVVQVTADITWPHGAAFGPAGVLTLNLGRLGHAWFAPSKSRAQNALLIHEYAHFTVSDHLSADFYDRCCDLGAALAEVAIEKPGLVRS